MDSTGTMEKPDSAVGLLRAQTQTAIQAQQTAIQAQQMGQYEQQQQQQQEQEQEQEQKREHEQLERGEGTH